MCGVWGAETFLSETGQFIVHAYPAPQFGQRIVRTDPVILKLEPQLLAVTAERTKRIFLQELGQGDNFRGKVHVTILDRAPIEQPITLVARKYSDGFQYQLGIP